VGKIKSVVGHVVVFQEDRRYAYYAAPGGRIFERDVVYTLKGSRCRVQLDTSDVATMGENTRLMIKTYLDNRQTKVKSTTFAMNRGKAMFYALRLFKYRGASMEVETPTAVSGVRGPRLALKFRIPAGPGSGLWRRRISLNPRRTFTVLRVDPGDVDDNGSDNNTEHRSGTQCQQ